MEVRPSWPRGVRKKMAGVSPLPSTSDGLGMDAKVPMFQRKKKNLQKPQLREEEELNRVGSSGTHVGRVGPDPDQMGTGSG
ncbi:hypothetical protein Scep_017808 [Stephania cephalantha]|uniref:Uncharacterized protein n=1 Tax=Stephania cephalantha TaxID=152367 RepID=A0AAP0IR53_9MAGN